MNKVIDLIVAAQQEDGYLNVYYTVVEPEARWSNLRDQHELYCAGHLIEAAVAHHAATGKRTLLNAICRYADYIDTVFRQGQDKNRGYPGHGEIELALMKLYHATGGKHYLKLAAHFLNQRGQQPYYFDQEARKRGEDPTPTRHNNYEHLQAHLPVREQKTAEGHAVRAVYLYAAMADVATETGDAELLKACRSIWKNIVEKRLYIHGGIGSTRFGERFTQDYDLPNEDAYAETCAAIGLVFFAWRMLQIEPDRQYAEVMERALYNGIISGVSQDGRRFFYDNYLASTPGIHRFTGQKSPLHQEWFSCACCPTNISRLLASLGQYIYSQTARSIFVHLYIDGTVSLKLSGQDVTLRQKTRYPWAEEVHIDVQPASPAVFTVALRIPTWCTDAQVTVNGVGVDLSKLKKGYLKIHQCWKAGDAIDLKLSMPVERIEAHPAVRHNCGRIALQRGPMVYCLEERDNGKNLHDLVVPRNAELVVHTPSSGFFKGVPLITGKAEKQNRNAWKNTLYRPVNNTRIACTFTAVPYFMWANRGEGEMLVWVRENKDN